MQLQPVDAATLAQMNRALIGFDRIFHNIGSRQVNNNYPPHNVIRHGESNYEIEVAVAGFDKSEISVTVDQDELVISGRKKEIGASSDTVYIHRGLATRDFDRAFTLPQYMEVNEVTLTDGVLNVKLSMMVPEALKPRQFEIK